MRLHSFTITKSMTNMKKIEKIVAWIAIIGGGIGVFFLSDIVAEMMR